MRLVANRNVELLANGMEIARRAADDVVRIAREAAAARGVFTIALAGGSTPKVLYALLSEHPSLRNSLPWDKMKVFFGDERHVGPGHADSNFQMASDAMLSKAPLRRGAGSSHQGRISGYRASRCRIRSDDSA